VSIPEFVSSAFVAAIVIAVAFLAIFGVHRARRANHSRPAETGDEATKDSWFFVHYAPEPRDRDRRGL
jgi:hypothetical protein